LATLASELFTEVLSFAHEVPVPLVRESCQSIKTVLPSNHTMANDPTSRRHYPMNASMAQMMFDATANSPGAWLIAGRSLKIASDQITSQTSENSEQIPIVHFEHIRKMLLGLAFEMILKAVAIMEGRNLVTKHGLLELFRAIDPSRISVTERDKDLLLNLEPFVVWAGRYPMPKKLDGYVVQVSFWDDNNVAQALWDRLYEYVAINGWATKTDGSRIPLRP